MHLITGDKGTAEFFLESSNDRSYLFIPINAYTSEASRLYYSDFVHSFQVQWKTKNVWKFSKHYIKLGMPL